MAGVLWRLAGGKGKLTRMESGRSGQSGQFTHGNAFGYAGRPKGAKRLARDVLASKLDFEGFAKIVSKDLELARRGDTKALLRYAQVVRILALSDGTGQPRPWNTRTARAKRQQGACGGEVKR